MIVFCYNENMKTSEKIYEILRQRADFISGEEIAAALAISRTSVWKGVQQLEKDGLVIDSVRHKGYRLVAGDLLIPDSLAEALGMPVYFNPTSTSTQLDAKAGIESVHLTPALYLASQQGAAKGRFGRDFFTSPTGGIYMSLHLKPDLPVDQLPSYTILLAAAVAKAIFNLTGKKAQIKWVNDIYLGDKKIAGILTEAVTAVETMMVTDIIMGIGLNFHITEFPDELIDKAGSLFTEEPSITRSQLIAEIWRVFFSSEEADLLALYKASSLVLGREITFFQKGESVQARALEVMDKGELVVELADGQKKTLSSGEVSLSSW